MRACSGTWIAHGSGTADRDTVDQHDRVWCRPTSPRTAPPRLATRGGGAGLLLRLRQRGPVAAVPHRAHAADLPRRRTGSTTDGERSFADAVVEEAQHRRPDRAGPGLPLRAAAAHDPRARCRDATIVTFWHIPWPNPEAFGICPWREELLDGHARQHDPRLPHPVPLQQLPRHGRPLPRGARRPRDLHASRTAASRPRCAATRSRSSGRRRRSRAQPPVPECRERVRERLGLPRGRAARRRRRPARLHQGHPRALRARSSGCSSSSRAGSAASPSCRSRRRARQRSTSTRTSTRACALARRASTSASARPGCQPIVLQHRAPRRRRGLRATTAPPTLCYRLAACTTA